MPETSNDPPFPPVALAACPDYRPDIVSSALDRLLDALPGWDTPFGPGRRVIVKPNLLSDHPPEDAVTTHPEVARAVIRKLRALGAEVAVADSPASVVHLRKVWDRTGFTAMCADEKTPLINLEKHGSRPVARDGFSFRVATPMLDTDAIVNLPKVKTHTLTTLTCGVKNMYGIIPGYFKAQLHKQYPRPVVFGRLLQAIHAAVPPVLTVADGVIGMQGEGPGNGDPVSLGFLAASTDAMALDAGMCDLLGIPPATVPTLPAAHMRSPFPMASWTGDPPDTLRPTVFRRPRVSRARLVPDWMSRMVVPWVWVRPRFDTRCVRCGRCLSACPVDALSLSEADRYPTLAPSRCIGCCCCHEICPAGAIVMRQSPLLRAWGAFKGL